MINSWKNIFCYLVLLLALQHSAIAQKYPNPGNVSPTFKPTLANSKKVLISKVTLKKTFGEYSSTTTTNYEYDRKDRLIRVDHVQQVEGTTTGIVPQTNTWSELLMYDVANRLSMVIAQSTSFATTYSPLEYKSYSFTYDNQSKIISVSEGNVSGLPYKRYSYNYLASDVVCTVGPILNRPLQESDLERKLIFKRSADGKYNLLRMTDIAQWNGNRDTVESYAHAYLNSPSPFSNLPAGFSMIYLYKGRDLENIIYNGSKNLIGNYKANGEFTMENLVQNDLGYPTRVVYRSSSTKREYNFEYIIK